MRRLPSVLLSALALLLPSLALHSCSPTGPDTSGYSVHFENPPASGQVGGGGVFFDIRVGQPADLDSLRFGYQDSAATGSPAWVSGIPVDPVSGFARVIQIFSYPATKRLTAMGHFKHNVTRTDQIYCHIQ